MSADIVYAHGYEDSNIIFCTSSGEMFYYDKLNDILTHSSESGFPFVAPAFIVNTMFTDSNKNLWIGSNDQGFKTIYNYKERFNEDNTIRSAFAGKSVKSVVSDKQDNLWVSTNLYGMFKYDMTSKTIEKIKHVHRASNPLESDTVYGSFIDRDGFLWTMEVGKVTKSSIADGSMTPISSYNVFLPMSR